MTSRSSRSGGSGLASVLMMGAGMLVFGLGSIATGLAGFLPDSTNLSDHHLQPLRLCRGLSPVRRRADRPRRLDRPDRPRRRPALAAAVYAGVVLAVAGILLAAFLGLTPAFFVPGAGSTAVRYVVLAGAVEFFLLASGLFFVLYRKRDEDFFFWYAVGMAMLGLGLIAATFIVVFDGPLNWAARFGQYIGACYILVAFLVLQRRASSGNVSGPGDARHVLRRGRGRVPATRRDGRRRHRRPRPGGRVLLWNTAAERLFGYAPTRPSASRSRPSCRATGTSARAEAGPAAARPPRVRGPAA